jgi:hypothetical protein
MKRWVLLLLAAGCGPPIPKDVLLGISDDLSAIGHPFGRFDSVEVIDWRNGKPEDRQRYADVAVRYVRGIRPEPNVMVVRVYEESVLPCKISVDVLSDDGPDPFLLDNRAASNVVGDRLCQALDAR